MIKSLFALFTTSAILFPAAASSQEVSHTTNFALVTRVGSNTVRYSLADKQRVVMPNGVSWSCNSVPVQASSDGGLYTAGFICINPHQDIVTMEARCYSNRPDHELKSFDLTTSAADTGVITFIAECATTADGDQNPFLRRTSVE